MYLFKKQLGFKALVLVGLCMLTQGVYSAILIDDFNDAGVTQCQLGFIPIHGNLYKRLSPGGSDSGHPHNGQCNTSGKFGIGGEHDYINNASASNSWYTPSLIRTYVLNQAITLNVVGDESVMHFVYDGVDDNVAINNFGLNNVDFTAENVLRLRVSTSNNDTTVDVNLYANASNYSSVSVTMPNSGNVYQYLDIPLSDFEKAENVTGTGVDLSDVKSIEFIFTNTATTAGEEDSPVVLAELVPNAAAFGAVCTAVGTEQCQQYHFGLGVDHIEVTKQLSHTLAAEILTDTNGDGDIDSAADLEGTDTFRYTITLTNTDDLLDAPASNVVYTANFSPLYADFIAGSVSTSQGVVATGNTDGDGSVVINIGDIADGETITITYDMKVKPGIQDTPSIIYSHHGNIAADEWATYDTNSVDVLINRFDLVASIAYSVVGGGGDGDSYPGAGEEVEVTLTIKNIGPNASANIAVMLDPLVRGNFVADSQSATGTGSLSCGDSTAAINNASLVTFGVINPGEIDTVKFKFTVEHPFSFGEHSTAEVRMEVSGLCDQFSVFSYPYPLVITVDAFPNHAEAHIDADADGLPDECENDCVDSELTLDPSLNDTNNDGVENDPDNPDADDDGDGVPNGEDAFPFDPDASIDTDGDGMPDECANNCANSQLTTDTDDDNDGVPDISDAFPLHCQASVDTDGDGMPDSFHNPLPAGCVNDGSLIEDDDDDNDGVLDINDAFPLNVAASVDADGDGMPDAWNAGCNTACRQGSGLTLDPYPDDTDNDGVPNGVDAFPLHCQASVDTDGDGMPDSFHDPLPAGCVNDGSLVEDNDDDNDGVPDVDDAFPLNPYASVDADGDGRPEAWTSPLPGWVGGGSCDTTETPPYSGGNVDDSGVSECEFLSGLTFDHFPNDTDNNGIPNDPGNPDADDDGDGIPNGEDDDPYRDNNPPSIVAPKNIQINSTGKLTTLPGNLLKNAVASDIYQGDSVACERVLKGAESEQPCWYFHDAKTTYAVGEHVITWTVFDAAGNWATDTQTLTVVGKDSGGGGGNNSGSSGGGGGGSLGAYGVFVLLALLWRRRQLVAM